MTAGMQGSVFSALLTDMMEAVRWPAAATSPATSAAGDSTSCSIPSDLGTAIL